MVIENTLAFGFSADVKPMPNDILHGMFWQCMFALSMSMLCSMVIDNTLALGLSADVKPIPNDIL
jgi:hypothetical protein